MSRSIAVLFALPLLAACHRAPSANAGRRVWPGTAHDGYVNPIPGENALPGDADWSAGPDARLHEIEGYADRISAGADDLVSFYVSASSNTTFYWKLYRLGWYGGAGARAVATGGPLNVAPQARCPVERGTGLVRCSWTSSFRVQIAPSFVSGLYAMKLIRQDGKTRFVPLVIRDNRSADLLFQTSIHTYAAYNAWGGESLYRDGANATQYGYAVKVSLDRPFDDDRGLGQMLKWEVPMARFLEREGYDVAYITGIDVGAAGNTLLRAGMFMSVGHDEYWTGQGRMAADEARDLGLPLAFFSSNTGYWKIRYEDFAASDNPRTIVCYKAGDDPLGAAETGMFRGNAIDDPENELLGVMYDSWQLFPSAFRVYDASAWLFEGTGLKNGDVIEGIEGYEYDHRFENGREPPGLTLLARSPVLDNAGRPGWSDAVTYRAASGALVFASGSIYWSRGLDPQATPDVRVQRMTANVFHEALTIDVPPSLQVISPRTETAPLTQSGASSVAMITRGLSNPTGVAVIPESAPFAGQVAVTTTAPPQVLLVDPTTGDSRVIAGGGGIAVSSQYDNIAGLSARFDSPVAVAVDAIGRVYVADSGASVIRRIDLDPQHTTTTFAGTPGVRGSTDGIGTAASFRRPSGLAIDPSRGVAYVADSGNHLIRSLDLATRAVTTIAGSAEGDIDGPGLQARFDHPTGLTVAADGRIFVLSSTSRAVKVILPDAAHTVMTVVRGREGSLDGTGATAGISVQSGVAWLGTSLVVSDWPSMSIRSVALGGDAAASTVQTVARREALALAATGDASAAALPVGVAAIANGAYVADAANGALLRVDLGR